jgi:outer membrane protein assembly factor BamB
MNCRILIFTALLLLVIPDSSAVSFHENAGNFSDVGPKTSDILFEVELTGLIGASPVVEGDTVYVQNWYGWGNWSPGFYAIDALTGDVIWVNDRLNGSSSAAIAGDRIFVGSLDGYLNCLNKTNGEIIWRKKIEDQPEWWGVSSSPLIYNSTVYVVTFSDGTLHAFDFEGNEKWNFSTGRSPYYTSPAVYNGKIYFIGKKGGGMAVYSLDESGSLLWSAEIGETKSSPSVADGLVVIPSESILYVINASYGNVIWAAPVEGTMSAPAIAYEKIFVGTKDGYLYCFDKNGALKWAFKANGKIDSSPAYADGVLYFATNVRNGTIYALNATNGELMWSYSLNPPEGFYYNVMSSPHIYDGRLYIGADDGKLRCFAKQILWEGEVQLSPGERTLDVSGSPTIDNFSALAALVEASKDNFNISVLNTEWGLFVSSIANIEPKNNYYWLYAVNGEIPSVGAADFEVEENDTVEFFYAPWGVSHEKARYRVIIHVNLTNVLYKVNVGLKPGVVTIGNHSVGNFTALGALEAASQKVGFDYLVSYYESFGLFVTSIAGIANQGYSGWMYAVNNVTPAVAAERYAVKDGDKIWWYYSTSMNDTPKTAPFAIQIVVTAPDAVINDFNVSNATRGGNSTAYVNITALTPGWYVIVVSGVNTEGDYIAGIGTVRVEQFESAEVPVLIHAPTQVSPGTYNLYAGVYKLSTYPRSLVTYKGPVSCEVS